MLEARTPRPLVVGVCQLLWMIIERLLNSETELKQLLKYAERIDHKMGLEEFREIPPSVFYLCTGKGQNLFRAGRRQTESLSDTASQVERTELLRSIQSNG